MPFTPYNPTPAPSNSGFTPYNIPSMAQQVPSSQDMVNKVMSPFNPNTPDNQFVDPNGPASSAASGTSPLSHIFSGTRDALGQVTKDIPNMLATTGTRIAQAGTSLAEPLMSPGLKQTVETNLQNPQHILGTTVQPQQTGMEGAKQIGGQALTDLNAIGTADLGMQGTGAITDLATKAPKLASQAVATAGDAIEGLKSAVGWGKTGKAVDATNDLISNAKGDWAAIGQKLSSDAAALPQDVKASLQGSGKLVQRLAEIPGMDIPNGDALTSSDIQKINTKLNSVASTASRDAKPAIQSLARDFQSWAVDALDKADPGQKVGTQLKTVIGNAADSFENQKIVKDVFNPKFSDTSGDTLRKTIQKKMANPESALDLMQRVQKFVEGGGRDLTDQINAIKDPAIKKAFTTASKIGKGLGWTGGGLLTAYEAFKHL